MPASDDSIEEGIAKAKDEADRLLKDANAQPLEGKFAVAQLSAGR